jgi:hypothetical protein
VYWMHLAQEMDQLQAHMNMVINLKGEDFLG